MTSALIYAVLASAFAVANVAYGRLRAPTPRRSHAWFGCLAAPVMLLIAARQLFAFSWAGWAGLVAAAVIGQMIGWRLGALDAPPSPARWRLAVYAAMAGAWLLLIGPPLHAADDPHAAHRAAAGTGYQRLEVNEPAPGFDLVNQDGRRMSLGGLRGRTVVTSDVIDDLLNRIPGEVMGEGKCPFAAKGPPKKKDAAHDEASTSWKPAALARLERLPPSVRDHARLRIEKMARRQKQTVITEALVNAASRAVSELVG